jgi:hypothetical protein
MGEGNPWKNLKYWDTFPLNYLLCYFHTFFVEDPDFIYILDMQEYYQRFSLGRDQDARTTLRWLRLDYVYFPKNSTKKSESTLNNSATVFCKNLKMISRGPAYNVEPEIKDMESAVLSTVPQEKISCK